MNRAPQLPAATLERINAIPNRGVRAYETELAYQQLAVRTHNLKAEDAFATYEASKANFWINDTQQRMHRRHSITEAAEPLWWDTVLIVIFVIAAFVLFAFIDQQDAEEFPAAVATTAAVQHVRGSK